MNKAIILSSVIVTLFFCSCRNDKRAAMLVPITQTEKQDTPKTMPTEVIDSANVSKRVITREMAYEGINNYCHKEYDWSIAEENPSIMYVTMGEETEAEYKVVFRSYTGAFVYFYVNKSNGTTRMVVCVPTLNVENEAGTINLFDYL